MAKKDYADDISRDTDVHGDDVYVNTGGQGCETVWYSSVPACRALLRHKGKVPSGRDLGLCCVCSCHYSVTEKGYKGYPEFVCKDYKEGLSRLANEILRRNPSSGRIDPDVWPLEKSVAIMRMKMKEKVPFTIGR